MIIIRLHWGNKIKTYLTAQKSLETLINESKGFTGYIWFTDDRSESDYEYRNGIYDFYIFLINGEVVGAYAELPDGSELYGEEAYKEAILTASDGIMDKFSLHDKIIKIYLEESPEINIFPEINIKETESIPKQNNDLDLIAPYNEEEMKDILKKIGLEHLIKK